MANVGSVIDGKYEVLKQIGKGGMSRVYLAMDRRLNKQWAIKELCRKERDKENEIVVQGLIAEAHLMKKLDHPALPRIVDIIETNQTIFIGIPRTRCCVCCSGKALRPRRQWFPGRSRREPCRRR